MIWGVGEREGLEDGLERRRFERLIDGRLSHICINHGNTQRGVQQK